MDVLLIQPRWGGISRFPSRPPLGLAYIAGALRKIGCECRLIDMQVEDVDIESLVEAHASRLIGFSVTTWTRHEVFSLVELLKPKSSGAVFVAGGPHATALPEQTLEGGLDAVVRGYGEETITELMEVLDRPDLWNTVTGLSYRTREGSFAHNPDRGLPSSLEELPLPSFDLIDIGRYQWCGVSSSRGCPAGCLYCVNSRLFGRSVLLRTPQSFLDELEWLHKEHGVQRFYLVDEQFTFSNDRAQQICRGIVGRGLDIEWQVNSRVDRLSLDLLRSMKEAGCISMSLGIESGSKAILRRVHKGFRAETALQAVSMAKEAGIRVKTSWIVGLPGTWDEQLESIDLMQAMKPNHIDVFLLTIYPGTPLWHRAEEFGITIDRDDPPMLVTDKLFSDKYHLSYLSDEEVIQIGLRMESAMADLGYQIISPGDETFDPASSTMITFLSHLDGSRLQQAEMAFGGVPE